MTEVTVKGNGDRERQRLCQLADGELFVSVGEKWVVILCFGKPPDGELVRQIKEMLEPVPKAMIRPTRESGHVRMNKSVG